jgi:hypothetical protein
MTPDWAAKAVAVPYANYGNPQSLNLYSYVQNNPTTLGDTDGHTEKQNVAPEVNGPPVIHDNGNNTYTATQVVQTKSAYSVVTLPDGTRGTQQSVVTTTYTATFDSANQIAQGTTPESTTTATVNTYDGSGKQVSSTLIQGPTVELSAKDNRVVGLQDAAKHWWNANVGDSMLALGLATATTGKAMTKAGAPAGPVVAGVGVAIAGVGAVAKVTGTTWQNVAAWGQSMNPCNGDVCIPMP